MKQITVNGKTWFHTGGGRYSETEGGEATHVITNGEVMTVKSYLESLKGKQEIETKEGSTHAAVMAKGKDKKTKDERGFTLPKKPGDLLKK